MCVLSKLGGNCRMHALGRISGRDTDDEMHLEL